MCKFAAFWMLQQLSATTSNRDVSRFWFITDAVDEMAPRRTLRGDKSLRTLEISYCVLVTLSFKEITLPCLFTM